MNGVAETRYEAVLKVTGSATYEGEVRVAGMLHASLVEASISCGDVTSIDADKAREQAGFVAMVSYPDSEPLRHSSATMLIRQPMIHFALQPVALVVADTLLHSRIAARAVHVEANVRAAVTGLARHREEAFAPSMVGRFPAASERGNAADALSTAHLALRGDYETSVNNHHPMEPHAVVCWWDREKAVIHTSTQAIFATRAAISNAFAIPTEDVRVVSRFLGGGFGCKGPLWWPWMMWALLASKKNRQSCAAGADASADVHSCRSSSGDGAIRRAWLYRQRSALGDRPSCVGPDFDPRRFLRLDRRIFADTICLRQRIDVASAGPHERTATCADAGARNRTRNLRPRVGNGRGRLRFEDRPGRTANSKLRESRSGSGSSLEQQRSVALLSSGRGTLRLVTTTCARV